MSLIEEIGLRSKEVSTDSYSMSVGELLTLYRDDELNLHPEFQRFFRWSPEQKSSFIESLLLGIPIPSIFVAQRAKGTWEVVDGLQRLSTIFEVAGELKDRNGSKRDQLVLTTTKYLPGLKGLRWNSSNEDELLPDEAKLRIKRSRIDVNIILSNSDVTAKYELFQRLNTGGAFTTDQEVRNCLLVMYNAEFFTWMTELARNENFRACLPLTDRAIEEQFDLELLTRFLVLRKTPLQDLRAIGELGVYLNDSIVTMAEDPNFDRAEATYAFTRIFDVLERLLGQDSFKKYDRRTSHGSGAMLTSLFEVIAIGLGYYAGDSSYAIDVDKIRNTWQDVIDSAVFNRYTGSGVRASTRIPNTIELGRNYFAS